jgi:hypothetical protein
VKGDKWNVDALAAIEIILVLVVVLVLERFLAPRIRNDPGTNSTRLDAAEH